MLTVATILDPFSDQCFAPEWNSIPLRSDDYLSRLRKSGHIDLLFVESVWRGAGNSWTHSFVKKKKQVTPPGIKQITKLLNECKLRKIPTIFWAKEDPVHFDHFVTSASMFDYIATTDSNCLPKYKKLCKNSKVFVLPFAAQIDLHQPQGLDLRALNVCFAGTCRNNQYPNRAKAMEIILQPALNFNLHIYDRKKTGSSGEPFPSIYKNALKGGLPYNDIIKKYGEYKVFLNINSIDNSPTMFSRRVFELLGCGTPVISSSSVGIKSMLPEVSISNNEQETVQHLKRLLSDDNYWNKISKAGIRRIFEAHTYTHRLKTICDTIGTALPKETIDRIAKTKEVIK